MEIPDSFNGGQRAYVLRGGLPWPIRDGRTAHLQEIARQLSLRHEGEASGAASAQSMTA